MHEVVETTMITRELLAERRGSKAIVYNDRYRKYQCQKGLVKRSHWFTFTFFAVMHLCTMPPHKNKIKTDTPKLSLIGSKCGKHERQ